MDSAENASTTTNQIEGIDIKDSLLIGLENVGNRQ